jgi:hypothetical protein
MRRAQACQSSFTVIIKTPKKPHDEGARNAHCSSASSLRPSSIVLLFHVLGFQVLMQPLRPLTLTRFSTLPKPALRYTRSKPGKIFESTDSLSCQDVTATTLS